MRVNKIYQLQKYHDRASGNKSLVKADMYTCIKHAVTFTYDIAKEKRNLKFKLNVAFVPRP